MKYWLAKGTMLSCWSLWEGDKPPLLVECKGGRGNESDDFCFYQETAKCHRVIQAIYGLEIMFPKLDMLNGGVMRIDISETERGYVIERIKK